MKFLCAAVCFILCALAVSPSVVQGQSAPPDFTQRDVFVTDHDTARRLQNAQKLIEGSNSDRLEALRLIQAILDRPEDAFFSSEQADAATYRGTKGEGRRLLAEAGDDVRRLYQLEFGALAASLLQKAVEAKDYDGLERLAGRFFHTDAGYEATFLLGTHYLDTARPLAAAFHLERLKKFPAHTRRFEPSLSFKTAVAWSRAGDAARAQATLDELQRQWEAGAITRPSPLWEQLLKSKDLSWLWTSAGAAKETHSAPDGNWWLYRGNPSRTATGSVVAPAMISEWESRTLDVHDFPQFEQFDLVVDRLRSLAAHFRENDFVTVPAASPLIVDGTVILASPANVQAFDPRSGDVLWKTALNDASFLALFGHEDRWAHVDGAAGSSPVDQFLIQRTYRDLTAGTLSSDGRMIFAVEDCGFLGAAEHSPDGPQHPLAPTDYNRLVAYELAAEGRATWGLGGAPTGSVSSLAGAFFLGPPLPIHGRLYCLLEQNGEIRLIALASHRTASGESVRVEWSQPLLIPEQSLLQSPVRRMAGLSPSYADGVMVCPTAAGAIVGIDLSRHELRWAYRYSAPSDSEPPGQRVVVVRPFGNTEQNRDRQDDGRWIDSVPTAAAGRVLLTPRDSDELHCLNLRDGTLVWKRPRDDGLYLAAIHGERVIVVGRRTVHALQLADGHPAWKESIAIPEPSGRGVHSGRLYHLPLSTGEIVTVDLTDGRVLARSKLPGGRIAGNLVSAGDVIISHSPTSLFAVLPAHIADEQLTRKVQADPENAASWSARGVLRLHSGAEDDAVADFRRSLQLQPNQPAKERLAGYLLEKLRIDFAKHREIIPELDRLLEDGAQRARLQRIRAEGLFAAGDVGAAFDAFLQLALTQRAANDLELVSGSLSADTAHWVRPRLAELFQDAPRTLQAEMQQSLLSHWRKLLSNKSAAGMQRFLHAVGDLPTVEIAQRELAERWKESDRALPLSLLLGRLRLSAEPRTAGYATARLVRLAAAADRFDVAANLVHELEHGYADVVCLGERNGVQLAAEWKADPRIAAEMRTYWPADSQVDAAPLPASGGLQRYYPIRFAGTPGPEWTGWTIALDQTRQNLIAFDGSGAPRWRVGIGDAALRLRSVPTNYYRSSFAAHAHGHLLVVELANHFVVLDTLGESGNPKLLWQRSLYPESLGDDWVIRMQVVPFGGQPPQMTDPLGRPLGSIGLVSADRLVYQVGDAVYSTDPLTGDVWWQRRNIPAGAELFGDDRHLFALLPNSRRVQVLRAADGEDLGTRMLPAGDVLHLGGRVVLMRDSTAPQGSRPMLRAIDAETIQPVWEREISVDALVQLVRGDEVAVLDPQGQFEILNVHTGRAALTAKIEPIDRLMTFEVLRSRKHYVLLTEQNDAEPEQVQVATLDGGHVKVHGPAYGFDRATGRQLWTTHIDRQAIEPHQPSELPVLVFTSRQFQQFGPGRLFGAANQYALAILDKQSGRIVHQEEGRQRLAPMQIRADRNTRSIIVQFYNNGVELKFSERK